MIIMSQNGKMKFDLSISILFSLVRNKFVVQLMYFIYDQYQKLFMKIPFGIPMNHYHQQ
jgi:hypothetical protein